MRKKTKQKEKHSADQASAVLWGSQRTVVRAEAIWTPKCARAACETAQKTWLPWLASPASPMAARDGK